MDEIIAVIITGMHRSGTSLVSNVMTKWGVHLGDNLLGPGKGNKHGHYENIDFLNFQDNLLKRMGTSVYLQDATRINEYFPHDSEMAKEIINKHTQSPMWGWKDPRTSLFLDMWDSLLPNAKFIFVYRHPLEVALSICRRDLKEEVSIIENPYNIMVRKIPGNSSASRL